MKKKVYLLLSIILTFIGCSHTSKYIKGDPLDFVNPLIGTGYHGHTYPGATVPNGAVQLSPDTRNEGWDACAGYHYSDSSIIGFSHTHLSGTGCADLGDILFHPTTKGYNLTENDEYIFDNLTFSHNDEKASAGYYSVKFSSEKISAELTATKYSGIHRYTYAANEDKGLIIDLNHTLTEEVIDLVDIHRVSSTEIAGMRRTQGWVTNQYIYFVAQFSKPIDSLTYIVDKKVVPSLKGTKGTNVQSYLYFGKANEESNIVVKVGLSIVSEENARQNLVHDTSDLGFDFDAIYQNTRALWKDALADYNVKSTSKKDLINFYTALYHTKIIPNIISDTNGDFRRHDMSIGNNPTRKKYSTFSLWDTFRAWHPLISLTDTKLVIEMINSFLDIYETTGELPIWPLSAGETHTMIGYHAVSVIYDAYSKGIRDFDIEKAYHAMKHSSNINKKGSDYYIKYGFIPSNIKKESVSCLLEYAYDDWCIAQMAKDLGYTDDYDEYIKRAQNYINVFDGSTKFFRGKRLDGNFESPFNTFEPGRAYTEATAWQYRFFVPHDINGLIQLYGGYESFASALDSLFTIEKGVDGDLVDITGLLGQYAHGNEPSHHMAYLYSYIGQPWKTQEMTRRLLNEMYSPTPEGIIGNEDCGQMSAWYIFSSIGFYPVCPGSNEFILTTPLFDEVIINLANKKNLTIKANNANKYKYIESVMLNGELIDKNFITYEEIKNGGTLEFTLSNKPNKKRGTQSTALPYSLTNHDSIVSVPYTTKDLYNFENLIVVNLASTTKDAIIYYTLDGSEPTENSHRYIEPFPLSESTLLKAKAYKKGFQPSATFSILATRAEYKKPTSKANYQQGINYQYFEGYFNRTSDLLKHNPIEVGTMENISINSAKQEDHFGYIFTGFIYAPETGVYEFATKSDDGSVLIIDNEVIVDNDGSHAAIVANGKVALQKGHHPFKLLYFEDYEGEHLSWYWTLPNSNRSVTIPNKNLYK